MEGVGSLSATVVCEAMNDVSDGEFAAIVEAPLDARAREVRKAVLLDVYERFMSEVANERAARWLTVPEGLRR